MIEKDDTAFAVEELGLELPLPTYDSVHQNGITDPCYPVETPQGIDQEAYKDYRGRIDKQGFLTIVKADTGAATRGELRDLLQGLSVFARESMLRKPSKNHLRPLEYMKIPETYRVTVTIGLGATLFNDKTGHDRFGLRALRPSYLKLMPGFPGDAFSAREAASDLLVVIASDHPYVNVAVARDLAEHFSRRFREYRGEDPASHPPILMTRSIETGFARPDKREFLRFDDGIDNLRWPPLGDMRELVYVSETDPEPEWCRHGSYMVYRKIRENMPVWEAFSKHSQEKFIGREKQSGAPLSRQKTGPEGMTPVYPDPKDPRDGPLNAHIRKVQPRRSGTDLFGIEDTQRRFLRRPYPFFEGLDPMGNVTNGLHFLTFMKSITQQFEHVTNMWQMNPDFPVPGTGIDALYARDVLSTVDGGYYFCPAQRRPDRAPGEDFVGAALFE